MAPSPGVSVESTGQYDTVPCMHSVSVVSMKQYRMCTLCECSQYDTAQCECSQYDTVQCVHTV